MKRGLIQKGKHLLVLLLAVVMLLSFSACTSQSGGTNNAGGASSVKMERGPEPQACQIANAATTLALRQYIYARLKTEAFVTADFKSMPVEELATIVDEALAAWETEDLLASGAEAIADRAQLILEASGAEAPGEKPAAQFAAKKPAGMTLALAAAGSGQEADPRAWAENFTKQFDAIKGNQKIKQLAQQLGQDAQSVHEQLELAQAIIHNEATADAAFWDKMTKAALATKTACKVALFVGATVATGGGTLSALGASSMTLGQAGVVIISGTDCIVDIASTGSTIILGENHQVTLGMNDLKDNLAPVSAVVGLLTFDVGKTEETIAYIGESLTEWFSEGKIMGINLTTDEKGGTVVEVEPIDVPEEEDEVESAVEDAGFTVPQETDTDITELTEEYEMNAEEAAAALDGLGAEMDAVEAEGPDAQPDDGTDEDGQPAETQQQPPAPAEMDVTGTYDVTGTAYYDGEPDDFTPFQATVQLDGTNMVITFANDAGTVLEGTYDKASATFTGIDPNMPEAAGDSMEEQMEALFSSTYWMFEETTIRFTISGDTVTGEGGLEGYDEGALANHIVFEIKMVKVS